MIRQLLGNTTKWEFIRLICCKIESKNNNSKWGGYTFVYYIKSYQRKKPNVKSAATKLYFEIMLQVALFLRISHETKTH